MLGYQLLNTICPPVKLHIDYKILQLTYIALMVLALKISANSLSNSILHGCFDHSMQALYGYLELWILQWEQSFYFFQNPSCEVTFLPAFRNQTQLQSLGLDWKTTCIVRPLVIYLYFSTKSLTKRVNGPSSLQNSWDGIHRFYKSAVFFLLLDGGVDGRWCLMPVLPSGTFWLVSLCCTSTGQIEITFENVTWCFKLLYLLRDCRDFNNYSALLY